MTLFNKVLKLSKQIGVALLRNKPPTHLKKTELFNEEDKAYILNELTNEKDVKQRLEIKKAIDKKKGWARLETKIEKPVKKLFWRYAAAAAIFLALTFTYFFKEYSNNTSIKHIEAQDIATTSEERDTDKAILTLEDGSQVVLETGETFQNKNVKSDGKQITYGNSKNNEASKLVYNYLTVPRGGQFAITLSDNTRVWLNSESQLKYPVNFIKDIPRNVELVYGEAYFDVAHNELPFSVTSDGQEVKVLGTEFNIKAYREDEIIKTTLVEGKINISGNHTDRLLKPNEQACFKKDANSIVMITEVDVSEAVSWRHGLFTFNEEVLDEIIKTMSRWYDVDYVFETSKCKEFVFTGVLERTEDIKDILKLIQETSEGEVTFEITNDTIIIK